MNNSKIKNENNEWVNITTIQAPEGPKGPICPSGPPGEPGVVMLYFKKEKDGIVQYHACSHMPFCVEDMIPITYEEYEEALAKVFEDEE